ncbi:MAG TPA: hypothetical protein VGA63_05795 [Geopsychrobacteraceae bacterium]|jgi:hypothetical protein
MTILKAVPYAILIPAAILLGLAPFVPQPHLLEKVGMLFAGLLVRPVDIFDLVMHGAPIVLLAAKFLVERKPNP